MHRQTVGFRAEGQPPDIADQFARRGGLSRRISQAPQQGKLARVKTDSAAGDEGIPGQQVDLQCAKPSKARQRLGKVCQPQNPVLQFFQ